MGSPILMLILPHAEFMNMRNSQLKCEVDCDGLLISFSFKMLILAVGTWAVFYRPPRATLPRIHLFRALITLLLFVFLLYLALLLLELRHTGQPQYLVKVVRSPDGESRSFPMGKLSIQRAAGHILEQYYTQFPIY